jgi:transposase-like protein
MVLIAIDKETGSLIESDNVNYTKSIKRKFRYYCVTCNAQLEYVNGYKRARVGDSKKKRY